MRRKDWRGLLSNFVCLTSGLAVLLGLLLAGPVGQAGSAVFGAASTAQNRLLGIKCIVFGMALFSGYAVLILIIFGWRRRGLRFALVHLHLYSLIRKALLEGDRFSVEEKNGLVTLPKIKIILNDDLIRGKISIENRIKYTDYLEKLDLSCALGKYLVSAKYITTDKNFWIFEIESVNLKKRLIFSSGEEMRSKCRGSPYELTIDAATTIPITSALICGSTGSGKSYAVYSFVLQLLAKTFFGGDCAHIYYADPKMSGLFALGHTLSPERTGSTISEIGDLLEDFYSEMLHRRELMLDRLAEKGIDSDYKDFGFAPYVLIIEEYSSFASLLTTADKVTRDRTNSLIKNFVQMGRQLGFFVWIIMQKSDASTLPTDIRTNLPFKVVLGNATDTTYLTAFELTEKEIPKQSFKVGEGLYSTNGSPLRSCTFPKLDFDILEAASMLASSPPGM